MLDPDGVARREEKHLDKHERSAHLNRFLAIVDDGLGGVRLRGRGTVEDAAVIKSALAALSAPQPGTDPDDGTEGRDLRDHGARTWDALVETCQKAHDTDTLPTAHGAKTRVMVTLRFEDLATGIGTATLDTGDRLSAAAVRKLACDAEIIPAVLGTDGQILDVGRAARLVTLGIWLALLARDRHCAFPGCRRPPIACDAHHITHWANGGPTSLANMVLLCRAHHTVLHPPPGKSGSTPATADPSSDRHRWDDASAPRSANATTNATAGSANAPPANAPPANSRARGEGTPPEARPCGRQFRQPTLRPVGPMTSH